MFIIAFTLAAVAQRTLSKGGIPSDAAIIFGLAALVFVVAAEKPSTWPSSPPRRRWPRWALALAGVALLFGVAAFVLFWRARGSSTQFTGPAFWLWLISIPLFLGATCFGEIRDPQSKSQAADRKSQIANRKSLVSNLKSLIYNRELIILLLIFLAAFFLRTWQLDAIPVGCQSDECNNGLDALEWLAAMCSHVPNKGEQMVRYYGYYSNVSRGKRKKQDLDDIIPSILEFEGSSKAFRKNWARLIQKIYKTDPLGCPKCSGKMKILSFIEDPEVIKKILNHLGL